MRQKAITHLNAWIILVSLVAFAVFNAANYRLLSLSYYERITTDDRIHTETVAFGVSSFFETAYQVVGEMAQTDEIRSMDPARQQSFIEDRFAQYGYFDNITVQRVVDGAQTARVKGALRLQPERWWFRKVLQDRAPFVSPSFYTAGIDANRPIATNGIFFPVTRDDKLVAVLAAFLRTDEVQERAGRYYRSDDRHTYILDEEGKAIVHPEGEAIKNLFNFRTGTKSLVVRDEKGKTLFDNQNYLTDIQDIDVPVGLRDAVTRALDGYAGTAEFKDSRGEVFLCSYAPVRMPGYSASWAAITIQDKGKAMASLLNTVLINGLLSFFIFAGLAGLLILQGRTLDRNARKLSENNTALEHEIAIRTRTEMELTAANQELVATNDTLSFITGQLETTNSQMAQEIEGRRAVEEKLRLRDRQYRAALQLLTDNTAELDVQIEAMLDGILSLAGAEDGSIALFENGVFTVRYSRGNHISMQGERFSPSAGLAPELFDAEKLRYIENYHELPGRRTGEPWDSISSVILIPLRDKEQMIGSLGLSWRNELRRMATDELEVLQQYADLASLALQGARTRDKISYIAFHDPLTGLPNRSHLMDRLGRELGGDGGGQSSGAMVFVDLDDLKSINDNFGHSAGDTVIAAAGNKIREAVGESAFISRLGGDEFIIWLPGHNDTAEIAAMADRLVEYLCHDYFVGGTSVRVSASIGLAVYPQDGATAEELMVKADNAMYVAKAAGRNCWRFFEPEMLRDTQEKLLLTNSLRKAIDRQELFLVYQPQIAVEDGRVVGFEALLRWNSPEHGVVSPTKFIPLAEDSNTIIAIGRWVLGKACEFAKTLAALGYPDLRVAVNLSAKQVAYGDFAGNLQELVAAAGIRTSQLELEVTESAFMISPEENANTLRGLKNLGFSIALDDFGTGYSSLTYLRLFPVEKLKIDKSFIDSVPDQETILVKSLIRFAQSLEMTVVAEGVESAEQLDFLASCGCDLIQGFLLSRPLPEEEALRFMAERNGRSPG